MSAPLLYTYYRSGAAQHVRIGLALKRVAYESLPVHLVRNGGEHLLPAYRAINPQARVPTLRLVDGTVLAQSSAILEYLEETIPQPPLLTSDPIERAQVRRVSAIIGCDIHPLNNVGPLNELRRSGWSVRVRKVCLHLSPQVKALARPLGQPALASGGRTVRSVGEPDGLSAGICVPRTTRS
jgi:maleylacetoacetate isomerase